ncbi:Asp-tRNA(Asn)/Glu-tRNA(Gln) amidotransferase subunit GatC [soil metagenome]
MAVTIEDVDKIATLSKLKFKDEEKVKLQKDMNKILEYIEQINELDLENVKPLENINETENVVREDVVMPGLTTEEALKNAPAKTGRYFKVPKVM